MMRRVTGVLPFIALAALVSARAHGATVTGTVIDAAMPTGQPIPFINVEVQNGADNSIIETVLTDASGVYTATVPNSIVVRAVAKWEFTIRPAAFYQNKVIRLLDEINGATTVKTYTQKPSMSMNSGVSTLTLDITMDQVQPVGLTTLFTEIERSLDYVRTHKGAVAWLPNYDIPVHIRADAVAQFDPNDKSLHIEKDSFDGTGTSFHRVALYHETNHLVHYYLNGGSFPPIGVGCRCHGLTTEEDPACAFVEAWASYVAQLTAEFVGVTSASFAEYRDPMRTNWRGGQWIPSTPGNVCDSGASDNTPSPTGYDGCPAACRFESGEIVEGAVGGALFGWDDEPSLGFEANLKVVASNQPADITSFAVALTIQAGGVDSIGAVLVFGVLADHGIVYSRARFQSTPIVIDAPPNVAVPDVGNVKEIDGALFVRGIATAQFEAVSATDLGVSLAIPIKQVGLEFDQATDDLDGFPDLANPLPFVDFAMGTLKFDTAGPGWQDGDCDLVLVARNVWGFSDNRQPTWAPFPALMSPADGNTLVDTDEKYFKIIGGWYDKDRDPTTPALDPAIEGKVIVDNTPPTVSGFLVGPPVP